MAAHGTVVIALEMALDVVVLRSKMRSEWSGSYSTCAAAGGTGFVVLGPLQCAVCHVLNEHLIGNVRQL